MMHYVIGEVDMGKPIVVREVEMRQGESKEDLEERIHKVEHVAIVDAVAKVLKELGRERRDG